MNHLKWQRQEISATLQNISVISPTEKLFLWEGISQIREVPWKRTSSKHGRGTGKNVWRMRYAVAVSVSHKCHICIPPPCEFPDPLSVPLIWLHVSHRPAPPPTILMARSSATDPRSHHHWKQSVHDIPSLRARDPCHMTLQPPLPGYYTPSVNTWHTVAGGSLWATRPGLGAGQCSTALTWHPRPEMPRNAHRPAASPACQCVASACHSLTRAAAQPPQNSCTYFPLAAVACLLKTLRLIPNKN